jgi:hypothetical protein
MLLGSFARPRRYELGAAINRIRSLQVATRAARQPLQPR